jgi:hypothetical protein
MKNLHMNKIIPIVALSLCVPCLGSCNNTEAKKATIEFSTNNNGTISIENLASDGLADLNVALKVTANPLPNYELDSLLVNGKDIISTFTFTPTEAINYIVNAVFLPIEAENNDYKIELSCANSMAIGSTMQLETTVYGPDQSVSYFISDPNLARVDANGLVTAKKAGFVSVTATATGSSIYNPATDSARFFIEPDYISKYKSVYEKDNLEDGVVYEGQLKYCYNPSTGDNPESSAHVLNYAFSMTNGEEWPVAIDFHLDLVSNCTIITMALALLSGNNNFYNVNRLGISYFGNDVISLYGIGGENHDIVYYYKELSIDKDIAPYLTNQIYNLISNYDGSSNTFTDILQNVSEKGLDGLDLPSYAPLLNSVLVFDTDPSKGIYVYSSYLSTIQKFVDKAKTSTVQKLIDTYGEDSSEYMLYGSIIKELFPDNIQDIRTTYTFKEDGSPDKVNFVIKDKKDGIEYKYINLDFSRKEGGLASDFFTNLHSAIEISSHETVLIDQVLSYKEKVKSDLLSTKFIMDESKVYDSTSPEKSHSLYDAINLGTAFEKDLITYHNFINDMNNPESESYVSSQPFKDSANLTDFKSYANFKVSLPSDTYANALPDIYECKVGDTFKVSDIKIVGDSTLSEEAATSGTTITLVTDKGRPFSTDIATYDSTTGLVSIISAPTAATNLVIKSTHDDYSSVTYRLHINI